MRQFRLWMGAILIGLLAGCAAEEAMLPPTLTPPAPTASPTAEATPTPLPTETPTPIPTPLGGGGTIVFNLVHGGIYLVNPDGSNLTQLTSDDVYNPVWSPDGSKIAAIMKPSGGLDSILIMDANGTTLAQLAEQPDENMSIGSLDWSPDGTQIVYKVFDLYDPMPAIEVANIDSATSSRIIAAEDPLHPIDYSDPAWSPDGSLLAIASDHGLRELHTVFSANGTIITFGDTSGPRTSEIFLIEPDGSNLTQLTEHGGYNRGPVWSPDGTRIAFSSNAIVVVDADGKNQTELSSTEGVVWGSPIWSPDGSRFAFEGPDNTVYVVNADGTGLTQVAEDWSAPLCFISRPEWSPDGQMLAFEGSDGLYVAYADGSGMVKIAENNEYFCANHPDWRP